MLRAYYFTAILEEANSFVRPLVDWLQFNGFTTITKEAKAFVGEHNSRKIKGNMDVELAVTAMELASFIDQMILFSGDGDFRFLVEAMQRKGMRVTLVSSAKATPTILSSDLRRQCDDFIELQDLKPKIDRRVFATSASGRS